MPADAALAAQYEAYPYPARDPAEEAKRLIIGSPSHLLEVDHWVFAARRPASRPLRALFAGGGSGDGAIMLAQQMAWAGRPGEVVWLDRSAAARRVAEARAHARGLSEHPLRFGFAAGCAAAGPRHLRLHRLLRRAAPPARSGRRAGGAAGGAGARGRHGPRWSMPRMGGRGCTCCRTRCACWPRPTGRRPNGWKSPAASGGICRRQRG